MDFLTALGDFLLSEWLWGITYGWLYIPINIVIMTFFLRRLLHMSRFRAIMLAITTNGFSLLVYSGIVVGVFMHILQWWYVPQQYEIVTIPFRANLFLGLVHFVLQVCFFILIHKTYRVNMRRLFSIVLMSNITSVLISYAYILWVAPNNF